MQTRIQKWGNSLAVRIPQAFASEAGLTKDSPVDIRLENGRVVISPARRKVYTLDELLADITPEKLHDEVDWGEPRGKEIW